MIEFISQKTQKLSASVKLNTEGISYSYLMKLLREKDVKVNGKRVSQDLTVNAGDSVLLYCNPPTTLPYKTLFIDHNILVVDKKSGFTSEYVFDAVKKELGEVYFIHRLDRNTAGIMLFALNKQSEEQLLEGFKNHAFDKRYHATVYGKMSKKNDVLTAFLVKDKVNALVNVYDKPVNGSVPIKTGYSVLNECKDFSLLEVRLYTGKTHQIRAHLAHIGHFILGDGKYGDGKINNQLGIKSQKLLSYSIKLIFNKESPLYYLNERTFVSELDV